MKFNKMKEQDEFNIQSLFQNHMEAEQFPHTFKGDDNVAPETQVVYKSYVPPPHPDIPANH